MKAINATLAVGTIALFFHSVDIYLQTSVHYCRATEQRQTTSGALVFVRRFFQSRLSFISLLFVYVYVRVTPEGRACLFHGETGPARQSKDATQTQRGSQ